MLWSVIVSVVVLGQLSRGAAGEDSLSAVWNEINETIAQSPDMAQCPTCARQLNDLDKTEDEIKDSRIDTLKQTMLEKLGLTEPPKIMSPSRPLPRPVKDGTLSLGREQVPLKQVTERVIVLFADHTCSEKDGQYEMSLTLEVPTRLRSGDVLAGSMWLYTEAENLESCTLSVSPCDNGNVKYFIPISEYSFKDGWSVIDIAWSFISWLELGTMCKNVVFTCGFDSICKKTITADHSKKPFIHVDMAPNDFQAPRKKRNLECSKKITECCRESLLVSFKEIGWSNWIIEPTDYNAYFCKGTCSTAATLSLSKAPYHSVMQKYNLIPRKHLEVVPCCTPAKLSSLEVILKDHNNTFLQRIIEDLTVESCGCM